MAQQNDLIATPLAGPNVIMRLRWNMVEYTATMDSYRGWNGWNMLHRIVKIHEYKFKPRVILYFIQTYIDGLVQERHNSSALAMELRLSCTNSE